MDQKELRITHWEANGILKKNISKTETNFNLKLMNAKHIIPF